MGDIKEPHHEGRCGACWDAGADKTDQDLLTITNGAFLLSVYYYTLIQFLCNLQIINYTLVCEIQIYG